MAALAIDTSSSPSLTASKQQPQLRPTEQHLSTSVAVSARIADQNSDEKVDHFVASAHKPYAPMSTVIKMMNPEKPTTNSTVEITPVSLPIGQPGDKATGVGHYISETSKKKISAILNDVEKLDDIEKLYLYLQLPDGTSSNIDSVNSDKKKVLYNPFGKKTDTEVVQTYTWIQSHLEEDISVSIPKCEVYDEYRAYCEANKFEKLCVADFGKAMKHIFPHVKPRRLGQRGNSKYCYSGLRKKILVETPELPALDTSEYRFGTEERDTKKNVLVDDVAWNVILEWVEKTFNQKFKSSIDFARHLIETQGIDLTKVIKSNESKASSNSHLSKSFIPKTQTAKKKDVCNQINKKLQDKKKCDTNGGYEKPFTPSTANRLINKANNHDSGLVCPGKTINCTKTDGNSHSNFAALNHTLQSTVKTEPEETAYAINTSPEVLSKVPISCNSFSTTPSSTILLLSGSQTAPCETLSNHLSPPLKSPTSVVNHSVCAVANGSTIKYKPIQPKPINLELVRGYQECENDCNFNLHGVINVDKRRHSVSTPFNIDRNSKGEIKREEELGLASFGSELIDNDKNYKRQIDEKDFQVMTKKRHVEENFSNSILANNLKGNKLLVNSSSIENPDLKVNEIETEALYDYLNTNSTQPSAYENMTSSENNLNCGSNSTAAAEKDSFVQIRKLLENHLGQQGTAINGVVSSINGGSMAKSNGGGESLNNFSSLYIDHSNSNSMSSMPNKCNYQFNDNSGCSSLSGKEMSTSVDGMSGNCSLSGSSNGQVQIPPSPNARRRAFSFQPISPRNTPTIPENATLDMNMFNSNKTANFSGFNNTNNNCQMKQMTTVAVGPSQPSSEANSPFISPRNTPIPVSRSRNNSGQSTYSAYRQTPLPNNNFDSGVSSISSSPFVSPHSTPIPGMSRIIRPLDNSNMNRNLARVRHSSGPGGPISRSQVSNIMIYNRSNSLSPMIGNSNGNSAKTFCEDMVNKLNVETDQKPATDMLPFNLNLESLPFQTKSMHRQRHFSNPYGGAANHSALMKPDENDSFKMLINRSQSVPLNQMFQTQLLDTSGSIDSQFCNFGGLENADATSCPFSNRLPNVVSKSYPSTPLCSVTSFKLPHPTSIGNAATAVSAAVTNPNLDSNPFLSGSAIDDILANNDSVIQSGQDLLMASVQLTPCITSASNEASTASSVEELNVASPLLLAKTDRDDFNDLLINDNVADHVYPSLDCDNEFSNLELENQANAFNDDVFKF